MVRYLDVVMSPFGRRRHTFAMTMGVHPSTKAILYPQSLFVNPTRTRNVICYRNTTLAEDLLSNFENLSGCGADTVAPKLRTHRANVHKREVGIISDEQCEHVRRLFHPDARLWDARCSGSHLQRGDFRFV